jgi:hypothetical protein
MRHKDKNSLSYDQKTLHKKLQNEQDFIALKRYDYDINKLEERYEECPDHIIAQALLLTEDEIKQETEKVVLKLRNLMDIKV